MGDANAPPLRASQLLALLAEQEVRYVIIGGVAAIVHGASRATFDIDIVPEWTTENLDRLAGLLADGTLKVHIQATYELERAPEALLALASTHTQGKTAISDATSAGSPDTNPAR